MRSIRPLPCHRRVHPLRSLFAAAALLLTTCCTGESAELAKLRHELETLRSEVAAQASRAAAHLALEFRGEREPVPGPEETFEVVKASTVPDPKTSDYADCVGVFLCEMRDADGNKTGTRRLIAATVFCNRELRPAAQFAAGTVVQAQLVPWSRLPASALSIQRVDETDAFDLEMFAALGPHAPATSTDIVVHPPDGNAPSQKEAIEASIAAIEARLANHGGSFETWHAELQPVRDRLAQLRSEGGGALTKDRRFFYDRDYLFQREPNEQWPEPQIAYFTSLRDQLRSMGIDLVVVPVTEKENITGLQFLASPPADGVLHAYREYWHLRMLQAGIEVVDLRPALIAAVDEFEHVFFDASDGHPANGAIVVAARETAKRLRRYGELKPVFTELATREVRYSIPEGHGQFPAHAYTEQCYSATVVTRRDGSAFAPIDSEAPVLIMCDSFGGTPRVYGVRNANFLAHLVKETGVPARSLQIGGGAAQLMVHLAKAGRELTKGVRVCVYLFRENYCFLHTPGHPKFDWQIVNLPR